MTKLFKTLKECKEKRKLCRIKPTVWFEIDRQYYWFSFLPTILWMPWCCRHNGAEIVDIWWLNFHIMIGKWERY